MRMEEDGEKDEDGGEVATLQVPEEQKQWLS